MKLSASRLLRRAPFDLFSGRVVRLVAPPTLEQLRDGCELLTASPIDAFEALCGEIGAYSDEYAEVRERLAAKAAGADSRYPDHYVVEDGTVLLLYALVRHVKPSLAIEVGVADGRSTQVILSAMDANDAGRLVSVDIKDDVGGLARGHPRWSLRIHSADRSFRQLQELLAEVGAPDLFFHDGSHTYYDQFAEYLSAVESMRPRSVFISDDIHYSFAFLDVAAGVDVRPVG